eukprot:469277-Rhodomonas_salina.1
MLHRGSVDSSVDIGGVTRILLRHDLLDTTRGLAAVSLNYTRTLHASVYPVGQQESEQVCFIRRTHGEECGEGRECADCGARGGCGCRGTAGSTRCRRTGGTRALGQQRG